jgi:hypothetical protein
MCRLPSESENSNPMARKSKAVDLDEDIKVGEGDETITEWQHGFDVIDEIAERLWELPPEFEWEKVSPKVTGYPEFINALERLEGKRELLELFEKFPGANLCQSFYDHGSPRCSGFYVEAFVKQRHLDYVQKAFAALLDAIDDHLEELNDSH